MNEIQPVMLLLFLYSALMLPSGSAMAQDQLPGDPTGQWESAIGTASLALAGDALSFSYSAVFGPSAHLCSGSGVAGLVSEGRYEYVADQDSVVFLVTKEGIRMVVSNGIAPFCGAGWPGDLLKDFHSAKKCRVKAEKAFFHMVGTNPPEKRKGYVLRGDLVEAMPMVNVEMEDWMLARFKGSKQKTVGLIPKTDLECGE